MRGLAEYVMTGRRQAISIVLLVGMIPLLNWLNPVFAGLVILRKSFSEGLIILMWASLPMLIWASLDDWMPLFMLLGITGLSLVLRRTHSWEYTLLAAISVGVCVEIYFTQRPAILDVILLPAEEYLRNNTDINVRSEDVRTILTGLLGTVYMLLAIVLLMLSRWLQAALYNPGGFKKEFHSLRIERNLALVLLALSLLSIQGIIFPSSWVLCLLIPLVFSGIALAHGMVEQRKLSASWLVAFYVLLLLPYMLQLLILVALIDSWYDFRTRMQNSV